MLDTNNDVKIDHVCAVITTQNNGLIVVSRKGGEYGRLGMPGGKVDEGETPLQAIVREIQEEIGLKADPDKLFPVYTGPASLDDKYQEDKICLTYVYRAKQEIYPAFINTEGCLVTAVESFALICKPEISPFYLYNQDVVKHCFVAPNDLLIEIEDDRKLYEELERRRDTRIKYIDAMTALIKTYPEEEFKDVLGNWYSADRRNTHCLV